MTGSTRWVRRTAVRVAPRVVARMASLVSRRVAVPVDRVGAALATMVEAERVEPMLPRTAEARTFWCSGRVMRRPELPDLFISLLPHTAREGWSAQAPSVQVRSAPVAADLVVMAKFDVGEQTKLRAAYGQERMTLSVQPPTQGGAGEVDRTVRAHQVVGVHAPGLIPPLLGHGQLPGGSSYVVERWLDGAPLVDGKRLAAAAPEILAGLAAVHQGYGVRHVRWSERRDARWVERWSQTVAAGVVPDDVADRVAGLLERDGTLRVSWTHGDLAASNVLATTDGIVLVDWEHSQEAPIMLDAAKLHLFSADPAATLAAVLDIFGAGYASVDAQEIIGAPGPPGAPAPALAPAPEGACTPAEELALCHARLLSNYPRRRAVLEGHPRAAVYERQVRKQVERLAQVLRAAP